MDEINSFKKIYNGITKYFINVADNVNKSDFKNSESTVEPLKREDVINALIAIISFDIIYRKEQIVEKTEGVVYKSKLSDNDLDFMLMHINMHNGKNVFNDSATMLAFIRNKLAHGDYCIDSKNNRLSFKRGNEDIFVDLDILVNFYIYYSDSLLHRFKGNTFTRQYVLNKSRLAISKPIETEKDLDSFLALCKIKKYTLKKLNGEDLTSEEKRKFEIEFENLKQKCVNGEDERLLDQKLIDDFYKNGYVVNVSKSKVKDEKLKDKIRECIEINNEIAKANNFSINVLVYFYGNDINKIINDYSTKCIDVGLDANEFILKQMYDTGIYDFKNIFDKLDSKNKMYIGTSFQEMYVVMALIRFYALYCYPLESLFKNNKVYQMDRSQMFPFDKLDLSEFKPDVININKFGLTEASNKLRSIGKLISTKNGILNIMEKSINDLSNKNDLNSNKIKKLDELKNKIAILKVELDYLYEKYMETSLYYNYVKKDYESDYFKNKTIIEGMRDALSHANIKISDVGLVTNIKDLKLEFNDMYQGNLEFNLKTSFYSLENLYEPRNVDVIDSYVKKLKF